MTRPDMQPKPLRIAMWSGPRNVSTAMMRSFESRADCAVIDEPFYAPFLSLSGIDHPMRQSILDHHETDWRRVAEHIVNGDVPGGKPIFYQKHMTHHMVAEIGRTWMSACRHAFLIRHPASVLASYRRKRESVDAEALGYEAQIEIYKQARDNTADSIPIVDTDRLLVDPKGILSALCHSLRIPFDAAMLTWRPGSRDTDGIWASHWYNAVVKTSAFQPPNPRPELTDRDDLSILKKTLPAYEYLKEKALSGSNPNSKGDPQNLNSAS